MSRQKNASLPGTDSLLQTKLMPPRLRFSAIPRDGLLERLDTGLGRKLTLLTSPTGFGKTTLVSLWLAHREFPAAWVTLDENDNDPSRFWTYFVSAVRRFDAAVGKSTLSALNAPQLPSWHSVLTPLLNDLAKLPDPCVLILDDFHAITSQEIHDSLSFLIQNLPQALHLVLLTRTHPDLPLPLLRARNELLEIDTRDLRFTRDETKASLLEFTRAEIPPDAMDKLFHKTDGWPAGLQLAALSLQNRNADQVYEFVENFSGSHRYVADYLIREVFERQSEPAKDFLLKTCFLKSLTALLCDATVGIDHSAALLDALERDDVFLMRLDHGRGQPWYRYSSLFAESIQSLARQQLGPSTIQSLFERASGWYEYYGMLEDAIETALTAHLYERVITLVEKYLEIHDLREGRTLSRWLSLIPREIVLRNPGVSFTFAQIILYSEDRFAPATVRKIDPFLEAAEHTWQVEENVTRLGQLHSFRGNVAWWQGDLQKSFDHARQSLGELSENEVFWRGNSLLILSYEALNQGRILDAQDIILEARALLGAAQNVYGVLAAIQILSEIFYLQGEMEQAEQFYQQILVEAVGEDSMLDDQGIACLGLANIAYERNELEKADSFTRRSLELGRQRANEMLMVQASMRLATIYLAAGDASASYEVLKAVESNLQNPALLPEIQNAQADLIIRQNSVSSLEWWVKITSDASRNSLPRQREREAFILSRLRILEGRTKDALALLEPWKMDATQNGRVRSQVEAMLLEALAYHVDSHTEKAIPALIETLTVGQSKGFRRLFLDEGARLADLLQSALPSIKSRSLGLFAAALLHSLPAESAAHLTAVHSTVVVEPLSQQELRVLRLLVAGMSNAEIARELVVSNNTVKTHVKSIYRKLNVKSREEAREMARELKLL